MDSREKLSWLLDLHALHSDVREWHYEVVRKSDNSIGDYHKEIIKLLREKFGCSVSICHFGVNVEGKSYVLTYYPVGDGRFELNPLRTLEG